MENLETTRAIIRENNRSFNEKLEIVKNTLEIVNALEKAKFSLNNEDVTAMETVKQMALAKVRTLDIACE